VSIKSLLAGGHGDSGICILGPTPSGRMILENFRANGREVDCFVDPQGKFRGDSWAGLPVVKLEGQEQLPRLKRMGLREFVVVSGAAAARRRIFRACIEAGLSPAVLTHPTAAVLQDVRIGPGCVIGARAILGVGTVLEENCLVGMGSLLDHDCGVGCHAMVGAGTTLGAGSRLEECAFVGDGVVLLPGRTVGKGAIVVSGSVVTQDVPAGAIAAGVSARLVRRRREGDGG
jgi:UDP-perosamine 4-acetyltransferase